MTQVIFDWAVAILLCAALLVLVIGCVWPVDDPLNLERRDE